MIIPSKWEFFYVQNFVHRLWYDYGNESFDEIMESILREENTNKKPNKQRSKYKYTFYVDYEKESMEVIKHKVSIQKSIDAFDDLIYNSPSALSKFYKGKILDTISKYLDEIMNDKQFGNGRECRTKSSIIIGGESLLF